MTGFRYCSIKDQDKKVEALKNQRFKSFKKYGLASEDYDNLVAKQQGRCAICGKHYTETKKPLIIDHCHTTGKVRGLLCYKCNTGLHYVENRSWLEKAVKYLEG